MTKVNLLICVPVYNCENQIERVIDKLIPFLYENQATLLLIDNDSQDRTRENIAKKLTGEHKINYLVIKNNKNYGYGGSHKIAFKLFKESNCEYLVILHGDDQANFKDAINFFNSKRKIAAINYGSRFMEGSQLTNYSKFRTIGNKLLNYLCSVIVKEKIFDLGSGLNIFSRKILNDEYFYNCSDDLTFNNHLIFCRPKNIIDIEYFPITWIEEDQISNAKVFKQAYVIIKLAFLSRLNKRCRKKIVTVEKDYSFEKISI